MVRYLTDIEDRKRAEQEREQLRAELAHVNRVTTMGELTASPAHEIKQPITASFINAETCLEWLKHEKPDLEETGVDSSAATPRGYQHRRRWKTRWRHYQATAVAIQENSAASKLVDVYEIIRESAYCNWNKIANPQNVPLGGGSCSRRTNHPLVASDHTRPRLRCTQASSASCRRSY